MATTTINADGTVTITLSAQEQSLAQLILKETGPAAMTDVFNLWFANKVKDVMNAQFGKLAAVDQLAVLATMQKV